MPKRLYIRGLPQERFWPRVNFNGPTKVRRLGPCWIWTGSKDIHGYGNFRLSPRRISFTKAHRFSFALICGKYPKGTEPHHLCENPSCVRPTHQQPVTHRENMLLSNSASGIFARRSACINGHEFTPENTAHYKGKGRVCRACYRISNQRRKYAA
jgi:HNH endonuclease